MDKKYWIGIVGGIEAADKLEDSPWWCVPQKAQKGDYIFMYCPMSVSKKKQGVFALCELLSEPSANNSNNWYCSGFGGRLFARLFYVDLKVIRRYKTHVTARDMKRDAILSKIAFVRRNFQATVFEMDNIAFDRIKSILRTKNGKKQTSANY